MNIQSVKPECVPAPAKPKTPAAKPAAESAVEDAPKFGKRERLLAALEQEPAVRPEELARGQALAADAKYPSDEMLAKLAECFVEGACRSK